MKITRLLAHIYCRINPRYGRLVYLLSSTLSKPKLRILAQSRFPQGLRRYTFHKNLELRVGASIPPAGYRLSWLANEALKQSVRRQHQRPGCRRGPTLQDMIEMRDSKAAGQSSQSPVQENRGEFQIPSVGPFISLASYPNAEPLNSPEATR